MNQIEEALMGLTSRGSTIINENANEGGDTSSTMRDLTAGIVSKSYVLGHLLSEHVADVHQRRDIHFHDLDYHPSQPLANCCLVDVKNMLHSGFEIGNMNVASPKPTQTTSTQLVQIIANVSNSQYGGCMVGHVNELLGMYAWHNEEQHRSTAK